MEEKNIHSGHRQRVRSRYLKSGISSMDEHNIIELLLFYSIPYKDTNEIAHKLVDKFGSISAIIDAPVEELMNIDGVGENTAALIKLVHDISQIYSENKFKKKIDLSDSTKLFDYLSMKYMGEEKEIVFLLSFDSQSRLQRCIKICDGSLDSAQIDKREIMKTMLINNVKFAVLAHNHPNGFAVPSLADVKATEELVSLLASVNINIIDHVIVAEDGCFSMANHKKYKSLFR
ncbi:MAG: RadC family protein [Ruminococcus sp.]|nr:RadC family protein [Candidatus Copronaster equi]